ncbi:MAG: TolC family protein [Cytophagales bacterium]
MLLQKQVYSQQILKIEEAVELALIKNPSSQLVIQKKEAEKKLLNSTFGLPNLDLIFEAPTGTDMRPGLMQLIEFPTVYSKQYKVQKKQIEVSESEISVAKAQLKYSVKQAYILTQFYNEKTKLYKEYDTIFSKMVMTNNIRYDVGQIPVLEKINSDAKYKSIKNLLHQSEFELKNSFKQLSLLCLNNYDSTFKISDKFEELVPELDLLNDEKTVNFSQNPLVLLNEKRLSLNKKLYSLEKHKLLPSLFLGYLDQGSPNAQFDYRIRYGLSLPIWFWKNLSKIENAKININVQELNGQQIINQLSSQFHQSTAQFSYNKELLIYYKTIGLDLSKEIIRAANESFRQGTINYYAYLLSLDQAFQIQLSQLEAIKNYNLSIIQLEFLKGL